MRIGIIAFFSGVVAFQYLAELPDARLCWLLILLTPAIVLFPIFRVPGCFLAGFLWALVRAAGLLGDGLSAELEGKTVTVTGQVVDLPQRIGNGVRFQFKVNELHGLERAWPSPGRVRLTWYREPPELIPGESWKLSVRLKRPNGLKNGGGFDYEKWLFQKGIRATGYVRDKDPNYRLATARGRYLDRIRLLLKEKIAKVLDASEGSALVNALTVGVRDGLTQDQWRVLTRTGTGHLVAISGLHIGLIAGFAFFIGRWLWSLPAYTLFYLTAPRFGMITALVAALTYAALAGFSIPTQRALIMLGVVGVATLGGWQIAWRDLLLIALFVVLAVDPLSVLSPGFWLSFGAVAVILLAMHARQEMKWWWRIARIQFVIAIALLPMLLLLFEQDPLLGPLANLVAVPWISVIVAPLVLVGALTVIPFEAVGAPLLKGGVEALEWLWVYLRWLSQFEIAVWHRPISGLLVPAMALTGALLLLMPRGLPGRWLGLVFLLPLVTVRPSAPQEGEFRFTLLDVGQGLAAVVQTAEHALVFDAGPRFGPHFDAGGLAVVPFLRRQGITLVDALVISHDDNDHKGGADSVMAEFPVREVIVSQGVGIEHKAKRLCVDGREWRWDGVTFIVLHPPAMGAGVTDNDSSCVLRVSNGSHSVLLTGDIESAAELRLVESHRDRLAAEILVVPHHGSKTSSSIGFTNAVAPEYALFSVGYRNRFGFPRPEVLDRYRALGARVIATDRAGAIGFRIDDDVSAPSLSRVEAQRYWHRGI